MGGERDPNRRHNCIKKEKIHGRLDNNTTSKGTYTVSEGTYIVKARAKG
jgi:hypothetical protein